MSSIWHTKYLATSNWRRGGGEEEVRCVVLRCVALCCVALCCVALRCVALRCVCLLTDLLSSFRIRGSEVVIVQELAQFAHRCLFLAINGELVQRLDLLPAHHHLLEPVQVVRLSEEHAGHRRPAPGPLLACTLTLTLTPRIPMTQREVFRLKNVQENFLSGSCVHPQHGGASLLVRQNSLALTAAN